MSLNPTESVQTAVSRRLNRALKDLGLNGVLPTNWLSFQEDLCHFSPISFKTLTRLIAQIEDASQLEPHQVEPVSETVESKICETENLKALAEFNEYQSMPIGYHAPQIKVG